MLPVLGYMSWFAAVNGTFNLSNSNGLFLWSRTMSFANCSVIKPPPDLQALCPTAQPGPLAKADPALRRLPKRYLWNHRIWAWQGTTSGFVPDTAAFTQANNDRALRFAILAIKAQPVEYAQAIAAEFVTPFAHTDNTLRFPVVPPSSSTLTPAYNLRYAIGTIKAYTGSDQGVSRYLGYHFGTRVVHVPAVLMNEYQHIIFLPGPVFGLVVLTGLVGIIIPSRRSWPAIFLWVSAIIIMVLPTAEHEYTYRYVIPAVPLVCMAAALAFRKQDRKAVAGTAPGGALAAGGAAPAAPAAVHRIRCAVHVGHLHSTGRIHGTGCWSTAPADAAAPATDRAAASSAAAPGLRPRATGQRWPAAPVTPAETRGRGRAGQRGRPAERLTLCRPRSVPRLARKRLTRGRPAVTVGLQPDPERDGGSLRRLVVGAVVEDVIHRPHLVDVDREAEFLQDVRGLVDRLPVNVGDRHHGWAGRDRDGDDLAPGERAARGLRLVGDRPGGRVALGRR